MSGPLRIDAFPLPDLIPAGYRPEVAIFIDVLRATTTITVALSSGVKKILPMSDPQEVLRLKEGMIKMDPSKKDEILTGGERKGVRIKGFDLGNSPSAYTPERVAGKTLLFSTTNGTRALLLFEKKAKESPTPLPIEEGSRRKGGPSVRRVSPLPEPATGPTVCYLASFLNAGALVERLWRKGFRSIGIVSAGTDRKMTQEDDLLAGLIVSRLCRRNAQENLSRIDSGSEPREILLNVQAETDRNRWETFLEKAEREIAEKPDSTPDPKHPWMAPLSPLENRLARVLLDSYGGENLQKIGLDADLADAARLDSQTVIGEYRLGEIHPVLDESPTETAGKPLD